MSKIKKGYRVLQFIQRNSDKGVTLKEIQHFIYFTLNKANLGEEWFEMKSSEWDARTYTRKEGSRQSRGYWCSALYGTWNIRGLLPTFCENRNGRWFIKDMPENEDSLFKYEEGKGGHWWMR